MKTDWLWWIGVAVLAAMLAFGCYMAYLQMTALQKYIGS